MAKSCSTTGLLRYKEKKMLKQFHKYYLKQRFFPNFFSVFINPFYLIRRSLLKEIKLFAPELEGSILDFGCGAKPYKELFTQCSNYTGVDLENEAHDHSNEEVDIYYDGNTLPFENGSFHSVFCTEVLEHVPNIHNSLSEMNRVLEINGKILITVPFVFPEHEMPFDFRRLTVHGIEQSLKETGFEVIKTHKYGSFFQVIHQLMIMYIHDLLYTKNKYLNLIINALFICPITLFSIIVNPLIIKNRSLYFGDVVLAKKIS